MTPLVRASALAATLAALSACTDGTGGAAGDADIDSDFLNQATPNPVDPLVGVWDLTGNWDGREGDAASLVIRAPGADGRADVLLYDLDDLNGGDNCYFPPSRGVAFPDVTATRVFMDRISPFDEQGELSLSGSTLVIGYRDGPNGPALTYPAQRVGISEVDLENRRCR